MSLDVLPAKWALFTDTGTQIRYGFDESFQKRLESACSYYQHIRTGVRIGGWTADAPLGEQWEASPLAPSEREAFVAEIDRIIAACDRLAVGTTTAPTVPHTLQLAAPADDYETDTWLPVSRSVHVVTGKVLHSERRTLLRFDPE